MEIWTETRRLAIIINRISLETNLKADFKLKNQIKSASDSVMAKIAEGFERDGNLEFRQFLSIAKGSAGETKSQLYRVFDYGYIDWNELEVLKNDYEKLSGKIKNFISYLNKKDFKGTKFQ